MNKKIQHLSITGPKTELDKMLEVYLKKYEFHQENALTEFGGTQGIRPYIEENPYKEALEAEEALLKWLPDTTATDSRRLSDEEALDIIGQMTERVSVMEGRRAELKQKKKELSGELDLLEPYRMLDCDLEKVRQFQYIKCRFGKIPMEYIQKFYLYVYDNLEAVFYECGRDADYVWGAYFAPVEGIDRMDALFSTVHFEKTVFPREYTGTPEEAWQLVKQEWNQVRAESRQIKEKIQNTLESHREPILCACRSLKIHARSYKLKKLAACVNDEETGQVYYILCGCMPEKDAKEFMREIKKEENVYCFAKDGV